jgi:hypothetical protein
MCSICGGCYYCCGCTIKPCSNCDITKINCYCKSL